MMVITAIHDHSVLGPASLYDILHILQREKTTHTLKMKKIKHIFQTNALMMNFSE